MQVTSVPELVCLRFCTYLFRCLNILGVSSFQNLRVPGDISMTHLTRKT